ncbi:WD repeat-containing protein 63 isoform X3 [Zootermopsis nevadensis]|uniref:WD repeat-containing protein 63 isoform X3 n=1 Tax=Zootermopsis nevadensis TaxID=136037 RepID=UPI000B8EDDF0|nr:WD repeat-containing protein 63 isoform X3 [Zootermopsis nevadensis]
MDKEFKFKSVVTSEQTNSKVKKRKRSEAQIEQWDTIRRQSTTVEDKDINIEGVVRLTLSVEMQNLLGCVIGQHVSSEMPWTAVKMKQVQENLISENDKSELFAIKESLMKFSGTEILVGYIFCAEKPNQFYICTTEDARKSVVQMIVRNRAERERRVHNCIYRSSREWISLGSEKEIEDSQPKHARPLFEIQTWIAVDRLKQPVAFQDRDVDDMRDGYVNFDSLHHKYVTVMRKRTDVAIQAVPEEEFSIAQTVLSLPTNMWTQYEFHVEIQKCIEDEDLNRSMKQFLHEKSPQMADVVRYNSVFDLHRDDYPNLVTAEEDVQAPKKIMYTEYQSFMDVKICRGKVISAAAWHPMWTGVVACSYIDNHQENDDVSLQDVFSMNPVLIWSFMDTLNPRLVLGSPRKVHALQFCPYNENLLVGGCNNGQVVVWDLCDRLKKVEEEVSLSSTKLKYHLALRDLMGWMRPTASDRFVSPVLISSLQFSPISCIKDIKWLSPYYEISHLGRYEEHKPNQPTVLQFLTCSEDGSICVWDLNAQWNRKPPENKPKKRHYKFIACESDVLAIFKPHYKFVAEIPVSKRRMSLSVIAVEAFPLRYMLQTETDFAGKLSMTERLYYKPEFQKVKWYPEMKMYVGSMEGQVVQAAWEGYEFNSGENIHVEALKFKSWGDEHDGPVSAISLSLFNKDLILSVGGYIIAVWRESIKYLLQDEPVLWRRSCVMLTSGAWSLFCPSMFFIARVDGVFEVWNFLVRSDKPILVQSISGSALTGIYPSRLGPMQNVIGFTDIGGNFRVFLMPQEHVISDPRNKEAVDKFFDRETEHRKFARERQDRWMAKNADALQAKKEAAQTEMKKREAEKRAKERLEKEKRRQEEEELQRRKEKESKDYRKEENVRKHFESEQEKYLIGVLLEKKKLDESALLNKKVPIDQFKEEERQKRLKQGKMKQKNKLAERVSTLFPEMVKRE